jgi:transposase
MKKIAASLRAHRELILNWFRARKEISAAAVEGLNGKLKLAWRFAGAPGHPQDSADEPY